MGRVCSTSSREKQFMQIFGGKPEGSRPLGRPRHRWKDNITEAGSVWFGMRSSGGLLLVR
jgi:hypothetical protein